MFEQVRSRGFRNPWLVAALLFIVWLIIYVITLSPTVNFIDSGELISALHEPGVTHPPGYPLYTLLGFVVSHIPIGEVAWRVNMISAVSGALAVACLYLVLAETFDYTQWLQRRRTSTPPTRQKTSRQINTPRGKSTSPQQKNATATVPSAPATGGYLQLTAIVSGIAGACLFGAAAAVWNRSIQAKMYTLHYFFVMLIFLLAIKCRFAFDKGDERTARRLLVATTAVLGLAFTNHLMTIGLVPGLALMLIWGGDWVRRLQWIVRRWAVLVPAFVLPLLLYLYLPLRSSQNPVMDWGTPEQLPRFLASRYRLAIHRIPRRHLGRPIGAFHRFYFLTVGLAQLDRYFTQFGRCRCARLQ